MKPVHTSTMNGHPLRFYRCPIAGKEDLVWHSVDDLHKAMNLPKALRNDLQGKMRREWSAEVRTVTTDGQPVLIAPHSFAQGMTGAYDQIGGVEEDGPLFVAYCRAAFEASREQDRQDCLTPEESVSRTLRAAVRGEAGHVH